MSPPDEGQVAGDVLDEGKQVALLGRNSEAVQELLNIPAPHVRIQEVPFVFRKTIEVIKDAEGKEIEKRESRRAPFKLQLPYPTFEGLRHELSDPKVQEYVLNNLGDAVYAAARLQVDDDLNPVNSQEQLDLSKLTLHYLAYQPLSERRGTGIPKEVWEAFAKDWIIVMPAVAGKTQDQATNSAKILLSRLQLVKSNKKIVEALRNQLAMWFQHTTQGEEFSEVYQFLEEKAKEFLAVDEAKLLDNI